MRKQKGKQKPRSHDTVLLAAIPAGPSHLQCNVEQTKLRGLFKIHLKTSLRSIIIKTQCKDKLGLLICSISVFAGPVCTCLCRYGCLSGLISLAGG